MLRIFLMVFGLLVVVWQPAYAVNPDEILKDPVMELRARDIGKNLRCLVCQNQSIDESDADLARDLRVLVRERLVAGDSDQQVIEFVVDRYGDYVLLDPPFKAVTFVLWLGPGLIFLLVVFIGFRMSKSQRHHRSGKPLTVDERNQLKQILEQEEGK